MRVSDIVLFGPPIVLGVILLAAVEFTVRRGRVRRKGSDVQGAAE